MGNSSRKNRHQREDKRYGHKQARQATRQVLESGGHPKTVRGVHWSPTIEQPPVPDIPSTASKSKRKGCKRNKNGPHVPILNPKRPPARWGVVGCDDQGVKYGWIRQPWYYGPAYVCDKCGKHLWNHKPDSPKYVPAHWTYENIRARLLGQSCSCSTCNTP